MVVKILLIIMAFIIVFASGFSIGCMRLSTKIYDAMYNAIDNVSVEENGADYVRGVLYACEKVDEVMTKEKEDKECQ